MIKSEQINELATALAKAQSELGSAKKDSRGHGYNYSDLSTVIDLAKSVLPKHGISYSQLVGNAPEGYASVTTFLMHTSGQFIGSETVIKIPDMRGVNDTQKFGAALSYGRRYSLQAILGMASEDNDASSEGFTKTTPAVASPKAAVVTQAAAPAQTEAATATVNGKSTDFSNRARQLRRTNGAEQSTSDRNESF